MRRVDDRVIQCLALLGIISIVSMRSACAQGLPPGCFEVCGASCVKPWTFPDRWNDNTWPTARGWNNNGVWDQEKYTDTNKNQRYDSGEPYVDGSSKWTKNGAGPSDGQYNEEYYDPSTTGYVAWKDLGLELTLKEGVPGAAQAPDQYFPIDLPGSSGADYRWNIGHCNPTEVGPGDTVATESGNLSGPTAQGMRDLIDQDPDAYWDDGCQCVKSQYGDDSPRIVFIPLYDPRIPVTSGGQNIIVSKIVAFFLESADVAGNMRGRLITAKAPGGTPVGGPDALACAAAGFLYDCPVAVKPTTWGKVKSVYR